MRHEGGAIKYVQAGTARRFAETLISAMFVERSEESVTFTVIIKSEVLFNNITSEGVLEQLGDESGKDWIHVEVMSTKLGVSEDTRLTELLFNLCGNNHGIQLVETGFIPSC